MVLLLHWLLLLICYIVILLLSPIPILLFDYIYTFLFLNITIRWLLSLHCCVDLRSRSTSFPGIPTIPDLFLLVLTVVDCWYLFCYGWPVWPTFDTFRSLRCPTIVIVIYPPSYSVAASDTLLHLRYHLHLRSTVLLTWPYSWFDTLLLPMLIVIVDWWLGIPGDWSGILLEHIDIDPIIVVVVLHLRVHSLVVTDCYSYLFCWLPGVTVLTVI